MKNEFLKIATAAAALAVLCGCETMYGSGGFGQRRSERDEAALRQQMEREQLQRDAQAARVTAQSVETQLGQLDSRIGRLESESSAASWATHAEVDALRRENEALRAEIASARGEHERLRSDIVANVQGLLKEQQRRAPAPQPRQASGYEHKVEAGQTLSTIAQAYGVSVQKIKDANKLSGDVIRIGQTLFIPD